MPRPSEHDGVLYQRSGTRFWWMRYRDRAVMHLTTAFGSRRLAEISVEAIEGYLRDRLRQRVRVKTAAGILERGLLKPSTVHQEFRVLRRTLNLAVRKKLLPSNPCSGAEF